MHTPTARRLRQLCLALPVALALAGCGRDAPITAPVPSAVPAPKVAGLEDLQPYAPGLFVNYSEATCGDIDQGNDVDHDGTVDLCERALASAFAPGLWFQSDCIIDGEAWDDPIGRRLGGDYGYAVQRADDGVMRIAYLPAYYADCGAPAGYESVYGMFGVGHSGDSEMIVLKVTFDAASNHWQTTSVFLSAHCGERAERGFLDNFLYCDYHGASNFAWVDAQPRGAPIVWVSNRKHANYYSESKCDRANIDECRADYFRRFPIYNAGQNIGSADHPQPWRYGQVNGPTADCQAPLLPSQRLPLIEPNGPNNSECWWSELESARFRGWLQDADGSTAYGKHLRKYAGLHTYQSVYPPEPGQVQISGSSIAQAGQTCGYYPYITNPQSFAGPYTYAWGTTASGYYASGEAFNYTFGSESVTIILRVTSASGAVATAQLPVTVSGSGGGYCLMGDNGS